MTQSIRMSKLFSFYILETYGIRHMNNKNNQILVCFELKKRQNKNRKRKRRRNNNLTIFWLYLFACYSAKMNFRRLVCHCFRHQSFQRNDEQTEIDFEAALCFNYLISAQKIFAFLFRQLFCVWHVMSLQNWYALFHYSFANYVNPSWSHFSCFHIFYAFFMWFTYFVLLWYSNKQNCYSSSITRSTFYSIFSVFE